MLDVSNEVEWGTRRDVLIHVLYDRLRELGVEVLWGASVVQVDEKPSNASLRSQDGRVLTADLILAADGIRSRIRPQILSDVTSPIDPIVSQITLYAVNVPASEIRKRSDTSQLTDNSMLNVWLGHDGYVVSKCSSKLQNMGLLFGIKSETDQIRLWDEHGDIDYVRQFFAGSSEDLVAALNMATRCDRWKLAKMPDLPRWTSKGGRIALLGDSAHAMLPDAAQGYSMIVEDIGVLEYLIHRDPDPRANMANITDTWQKIRKPRVERIKDYASWNSQLFLGGPLQTLRSGGKTGRVKSLKDTVPKMDAPFHSSGA